MLDTLVKMASITAILFSTTTLSLITIPLFRKNETKSGATRTKTPLMVKDKSPELDEDKNHFIILLFLYSKN